MGRSLTIGNFDGVHRGHQLVLERLMEIGGSPLVFTFSNHPSAILQGRSKPLLTTSSHKRALLESYGIDTQIEPFTEAFSRQSAEEFLSRFEIDALVLGHDAVIGHKREGHQEELRRLSKMMGFTLEYLPPLLDGGELISSSRIRTFIEDGHLEAASRLLGRPYSIQSVVLRGSGRKIGFPTANLDVSTLCLPPNGVYEALVDKTHKGIANLGIAPTFGGKKKQLEVHLLDFSGDLYGQEIEVELIRFLRPERKFSSKEELVRQIESDIKQLLSCAKRG